MPPMFPHGSSSRLPQEAKHAPSPGTRSPTDDVRASGRLKTDEEVLDHPRRVLLVEPSPNESLRLRTTLTAAQIEVRGVSDLITALHTVRTYQPNLILAQLRLVPHTGLELVRRINEDRLTRSIPVILYSDAATAEQRVKAFDAGAVDFLCRPFADAELIARVRAALRARHMLTLLEQRAHLDSLTGLANRGVFDDQFLREWGECRRHNDPLVVVIADLDRFKAINDTYGHATGDEVLRQSARVLARSVRSSDLVARYGGEEFVVVAPRCSLVAALTVAERFRTGLAELAISVQGTAIPITTSIGIAATDHAQDSPKELLHRADQALYRAKESGRNAVWVFDVTQNTPTVAVASDTHTV